MKGVDQKVKEVEELWNRLDKLTQEAFPGRFRPENSFTIHEFAKRNKVTAPHARKMLKKMRDKVKMVGGARNTYYVLVDEK